ncbi:MAG: hypothetical protein H0W78_10345 [Planctomycetes bacterium]|nr:hypothetical protein [Planctomycetota bacterium]
MRQPLGPADIFADLLDGIIRHEGGSGNVGQLRVHLDGKIDAEALSRAWCALGHEAWTLGARFRRGLRGAALHTAGPVELELEHAHHAHVVAAQHLREGTGNVAMRLALVDDGLVLTWDHRLCDARGAAGVLAALPRLAIGQHLGEPWWTPDYRWVPGVPRAARVRGPMAQQAMPLLIPHRLVPLWRPLAKPTRSPANPASPITTCTTVLGDEGTKAYTARQRQATGRMAETPFLLACVAAALEAARGVDGDVLMPLTVDLREGGEKRLLANCHGYCFLRVPAGLATKDLVAAANHLKQAHREWIAADGLVKLSASMSWFGHLPRRLARAQLGNHHAGVWASCVVANAGATPLGESWFGARVIGVDHAACIPGTPGIGVLFHRDARGLGFSTLATGRVIKTIPPQRFADLLRWQLMERPLG